MSEVDQGMVSAAIRGALEAMDGFAGSVARGRFSDPPGGSLPFAALSPPGVSSTQGPVLGRYTRTVVYDLQVWAAAQSADSDVQVDEAEALLDAVLTALERERLNPTSELYRLPEFGTRAQPLVAGLDPLPANTIAVFLTIELSYQRAVGLRGASP